MVNISLRDAFHPSLPKSVVSGAFAKVNTFTIVRTRLLGKRPLEHVPRVDGKTWTNLTTADHPTGIRVAEIHAVT